MIEPRDSQGMPSWRLKESFARLLLESSSDVIPRIGVCCSESWGFYSLLDLVKGEAELTPGTARSTAVDPEFARSLRPVEDQRHSEQAPKKNEGVCTFFHVMLRSRKALS